MRIFKPQQINCWWKTKALRERSLGQESAAKGKFAQNVDKLTRALSSRGSENRSLAKELAVSSTKNGDLQAL